MNSTQPTKLSVRSLLLSMPVALTVAVLLTFFFGELPNAMRWPARGVILAALLFAAWRFVPDSFGVVNFLAERWAWLWPKMGVFLVRTGWIPKSASRVLALVVILGAALFAGRTAVGMASTSLRVDEITSVVEYASQGPLRVLTHYHRANNHILLNLIHSILPGASSVDPLRVRFPAILATVGLFGFAVAWFWRRDAPASAAVIAAAIGLHAVHLHLEMQSRAYGFVSLFAIVAAAGFIRHRLQGDRLSLAIVAICTFLGTLSVPYFIVYGGTLMLAIFLLNPSKERLLVGVWTGCAVLVAHLGVITQMLEVASEYDEDYTAGFQTHRSFFSLLLYLIPYNYLPTLSIGGIALFLLVLFFFALMPSLRRNEEAVAGLLIVAAAMAFVAFCFVLESPPVRVAAFTVLPVTFGLLVAIRASQQSHTARPLLQWIAVPVTFFLVGYAVLQNVNFQFRPTQNWMEFSRMVRILFPEQTPVVAPARVREHSVYLEPNYPVVPGPQADVAGINAGRAVYHEFDVGKGSSEEMNIPPGVDFSKLAGVTFRLSKGLSTLRFAPGLPELNYLPEKGPDASRLFYKISHPDMAQFHGIALRRSGGWDGLEITAQAKRIHPSKYIFDDNLLITLPPNTGELVLSVPAKRADNNSSSVFGYLTGVPQKSSN